MGVKDVLLSAGNAITGDVIGKVKDLISEFITDKDKKIQLEAGLEQIRLTSAHETELKLLDVQVELAKSDERVDIERQRTFQAEVNQSDILTKQTRPIIARRSFNYAVIYAVISNLAQLWMAFHSEMFHDKTGESIDQIIGLTQFHMEVFLVIVSPALAYMGLRTADIWKAGGAKRV